MTSVHVGVHVHERPRGLLTTLASLRRAGAPDFALVVLGDGPDAATRRVLRRIGDIAQDTTAEPLGPPACFNRLARRSEADVVVLLESGCVVGRGWLDLLLSALEAYPRNGLAGPSTNSAWNQQAAFGHRGGRRADVDDTAAEALATYGREVRSLAPLHGLADFCFAVRRPVIDAIGGADEGFGLGPCWEMEYSARALRAGFRSVWACGAYVERAPFTARRRREEAARFTASKHRYQDAVCALKLRSERDGYEPHCRGEACEHFAPGELMTIRRPLAAHDGQPHVPPTPDPPPAGPPAVRRRPSRAPLVSCIMPTANRAEFALQAVRYFQRQDHEPLELIVVDDGTDGLRERLPDDPRIRYVRSRPGETIGAKRNRACELAEGELIVHWDDDDWYAPERVRRQIEPMTSGVAGITALRGGVFFDLDRWTFWRVTPELHSRLYVADVAGGTLAYRRSVWSSNRFPAKSLAEDAWFLRRVMRRGARLGRIENNGLFVYVRHHQNTWRFPCGEHGGSGGWLRSEEPPFPPGDREFYAARSLGTPEGPDQLVSCLMPTANRRPFVEQAVQLFLRQDHPACELIVLDDGEDRIGDLIPSDERIRYVELDGPLPLGAKRNHGCEIARGNLIAHWDDDDWSAPWRLGYQVEQLRRSSADVCGLSRLIYFEPLADRAWTYAWSGRRWVADGTLLYTRELWSRNRFPDSMSGLDCRFLWNRHRKRIAALDDDGFYVAMIHPQNSSRKATCGDLWRPLPVAHVRNQLGTDFERYASASGSTFTGERR